MPIEIKELLIKVTVLDEVPRPVAGPLAAAAGLTAAAHAQLRQDLTQDCVRQVLAELQRRRER